MKIIQLSDLHIGKQGETPEGVDVRANFISALNRVRKESPELLIITGDLCSWDGDMKIYQWIKDQLSETAIPFRIIPGNHDNPEMIIELFNLKTESRDNELYFQEKFDDFNCLFLDSSSDKISRNQLEWVKHIIEKEYKNGEVNSLVFLHHPPVFCGNHFMDSHFALENKEELMDGLTSFAGVKAVFCGHYHQELSISKEDLNVYITPSLWFQIDPDDKGDTPVVQTYKTGFRIINIDNGKIDTEIIWI
jgi:Icc protein